jgi:hypothetical protein
MPGFGGFPDPVRPSDRALVEWVATAKPGSQYPEPWSQAHSPLQSIIAHLAELGVMDLPEPGTDIATVAREATAAAKAWLERHPVAGAKIEPEKGTRAEIRGRTWGR